MPADVLVTARFSLPELIEQGRSNTLECTVYRSGAVVPVVSGTFSLYDDANAVQFTGAVSVVGGAARYTLSSAQLAAFTPGEGWRVEWRLTSATFADRVFDNEAMIVRRSLFPVVTEADLYQVSSALDPSGPACIHSETSFSDKLDEAWIQIQSRLLAAGNRPNLILSPSALRDCHLYLCLALIYEDFSTRLNPAFSELGSMYRGTYEAAWGRLRFRYDSSADEGNAPNQKRRGPAVSTLWLSSRGSEWRR